MPDASVTFALLALVALVEASPLVRLPVGLLLAIALLASGAELLLVALVGAAGVTLGRLWLALSARRGRDRLAAASPGVRARREAMQRHLASSPAYARMAFVLAALPGVPATFVFPLLGAMRAPLWPALAGTIVGRTPVLAITAAIFAWLGTLGNQPDGDGALTLGIFAVLLLAFRTISLVDWQHRAETGRVRLRDPDEHATRLAGMFGPGMGGAGGPGGAGRGGWPGHGPHAHGSSDDDDVVEGELLGEEADDDDAPPALDESSRGS